jgi:hypothetical protein
MAPDRRAFGGAKVARISAKFKGSRRDSHALEHGLVGKMTPSPEDPQRGRGGSKVPLGREPENLFLKLPLQRLDLFGQRGVFRHQCLDLAHGMQDRGVIASAEAAADLRQ